MTDTGIVRNRAKIEATRKNAVATIALRDDGGLEAFVERFRPEHDPEPHVPAEVPTTSPESVALSKALRKRGLRLRRSDHDARADGGDRAGRHPPRRLPPTRDRSVGRGRTRPCRGSDRAARCLPGPGVPAVAGRGGARRLRGSASSSVGVGPACRPSVSASARPARRPATSTGARWEPSSAAAAAAAASRAWLSSARAAALADVVRSSTGGISSSTRNAISMIEPPQSSTRLIESEKPTLNGCASTLSIRPMIEESFWTGGEHPATGRGSAARRAPGR